MRARASSPATARRCGRGELERLLGARRVLPAPATARARACPLPRGRRRPLPPPSGSAAADPFAGLEPAPVQACLHAPARIGERFPRFAAFGFGLDVVEMDDVLRTFRGLGVRERLRL